jgi:hypothetical protein
LKEMKNRMLSSRGKEAMAPVLECTHLIFDANQSYVKDIAKATWGTHKRMISSRASQSTTMGAWFCGLGECALSFIQCCLDSI